ncbi:hypothetical protein [Kitasatospora sp. McL0602]|uniref:hypothetical protein n=1 Tax=Kitasatospora sp. McL0602 TaxID=3439530 RepID=UPI003F89FCE1
MHLVHIHLKPHTPALELPPETATLVVRNAAPDEAVEHVAVHAGAQPLPVIGIFLRAGGPDAARRTARAVVARAVATEPALRDWTPAAAQVPLLPMVLSWPGAPHEALD